MAANMDRPMTPDELDPEKDLKPLADEIDKMLGVPGAGAEKVMSAKAGESQPLDKELEGSPDMKASNPTEKVESDLSGSPDAGMEELASVVGGMDKATKMYKSAMTMMETKGKSPSELAAMIKKDYALRSKLMSKVAEDEDMEAGDSMMKPPSAAMPPMGTPPMAAPPGPPTM